MEELHLLSVLVELKWMISLAMHVLVCEYAVLYVWFFSTVVEGRTLESLVAQW